MNRVTARWVTAVLVLAALPLMGPTCSGGGLHSFSANSLIIPMDECYQTDKVANQQSYCVSPNAAGDDGVLKAYGLVYFLIKHGVAVYWVINPNKTAVTDVDLTLVGTSAPALKYNWASNTFADFLGSATQIQYRGGPFVIDGSDLATVQTLFASDPDFTQFQTAGTVDIHQSPVAFTAPVAKTLAGVPPTLGLVDIKGGDNVNAETVLEGYLNAAGLGFTGAGGNADGPTHGVIYDRLYAPDLISDSNGNSVFAQNGYGLLWIPHWEGPGSTLYADGGGNFIPDGGTLIPILKTIGNFVNDGGNLFVECAGIGTLEGAFSAAGVVSNGFGPGSIDSRSDTDAGLQINSSSNPIPPPYTYGLPASPFSQIGDFPFSAVSGAINDFVSLTGTSYLPEVQQLVLESDSYSLFTVVPHRHDAATSGAVVYLGGHTYVGQTGGTRLVLNTLFNLSAACISPNTPCNTGLLGACAYGIRQCSPSTGSLVCNSLPDAGAGPEVCDGIDNDCNGLVDDLPPRSCYDGPPGTDAFTPCQDGSQTCVNGVWGACAGETLPQPVSCNGIDDACNGMIDLLPDGGQITQVCYDGPLGTEGVGICHGGTQTCDPATSSFGPCNGEQVPEPPVCSQTMDNDCNGVPDTAACQCQNGQTQTCYDGPPGTANVGICHAGQQTCANNQWGPCAGEQTPEPEVCDGSGIDYNCSGIPQDGCGECTNGATEPCWTGPDGGIFPDGGGVGVCHGGEELCSNLLWGTCHGEVLPGIELCDGLDNDCNGQTDDNAICPTGDSCVNGVCVPTNCSTELDNCSEGFFCAAGKCVLGNCGTSGSPCPDGESCHSGVCSNPCTGVVCGAGSFCSAGACVAGGCYDTACPTGQTCQGGACVTDPCANLDCPIGDFCREGFCVASCVFANCTGTQICDTDGQCVSPPCNGACGSGTCLGDGGCGPDICAGIGCASLQECVNENNVAVCVPDPCADVVCSEGVCVDGQCQRPSASTTTSTSGSSAGTGTSGSAGSSSGSHGSTGSTTASHGSTTSSTSATGASGTSGTSGTGTGSSGVTSTGGTQSSKGVTTGCGCNSGSELAPMWAMGLVLLGLRRRRTSVLAAASAAVMTACSPSTNLSTASSSGSATSTSNGSNGSTSGSGSTHGSSGSTTGSAGTSRGSTGSASGSSGSSGHVCPGTESYCMLGGCVDLSSSLDHCGSCNNPCGTDEICDQGFCGPSMSVNPVATLLDPVTANPVASVDVTVTGTLFQSGAQVVLNGGGAVESVFPATFVDAEHVVGHFDMRGLQAGPATIAVVNPGQIISNSLPFTIGSGTNAPVLNTLSPTAGDPNLTLQLQVTGTQFDPTTVLHLSGPGVPDDVLTTTLEDDGGLTAPLMTTNFLAGPYALYAVSDGSPRSNTLTFSVNSVVPTLTLVTPATGVVASVSGLSAQGTGFDASTVLHLQAVVDGGTSDDGGYPGFDRALTTEFIASTEVDLPQTSPLDLGGVVPGSYQIVAENQGGTKLSNAVPFPIVSARPTLVSVTPSSTTQNQSLTIDVVGQAFDPTSVAHFFVGALDTPLATTVDDGGYLTADLSLFGVPAGEAQVAVVNSGNLASNVLTFNVLSDQAVLVSMTPSGGAAGATVMLTLTGSNFEMGAQVDLSGGDLADGGVALTTLFDSVTQVEVDNLDLSPYTPGAYSVTVVNPNAVPSAALPFTIVPGVPTITALTPATASTNTIQSFTLTGTLFSPNAYIQVSGADGLNSTFPSTFVNSTTISLPNVNLSNVPQGSYSIEVVNPGPHASAPANLSITQ